MDEGGARPRPACRRRAHGAFDAGEVDAALAFLDDAARALRGQDRRAGRRQGRARHRRRWPRPRTTCRPSCPGTAFGDAGRRVVIEEGLARPGGARCCACATAPGRAAGPGPGLQAGRRRRRAARTPAAWAPTRRCPAVDAGRWRRGHGRALVEPTLAELRRPGHRLPRRALRRAHAHRRRAQGARVQRPLRRPRDPGRAAPARPATWPTLLAEARRRATCAGRADASPTTPPSPWSARRQGYPAAPRTGDLIEGLEAAGRGARGARSSAPAWRPTPRAGSSPPAGGCWTSPRSARRGRRPATGPTRRSAALHWPGLQVRSDIAAGV